MKCVTVLCFSLFILNTNAGAVSFIDPCHWNDADCILKSSKKALPHIMPGIPELGIPCMDPMELKEVNADNGGLNLKIDHLIVKELSKCELEKVERTEKTKVHLVAVCPIIATGQYDANGTFYLLYLYGHGDFNIMTEKVRLEATINLKETKKDDKDYYEISSFDYKYDLIEKIYIKFDNLYDGDQTKAEPVNKILDENWKEIINEFGKNIIKELITRAVSAFGRLLTKLPTNEIEKA